MKKNTTAEQKAESFGDILEDLVREKVQSFIQDILEEELDQWLGRDRWIKHQSLTEEYPRFREIVYH